MICFILIFCPPSEKDLKTNSSSLGGGFKHFLCSPRILGEMIQFDEHIFQMGWFNHQTILAVAKGRELRLSQNPFIAERSEKSMDLERFPQVENQHILEFGSRIPGAQSHLHQDPGNICYKIMSLWMET